VPHIRPRGFSRNLRLSVAVNSTGFEPVAV
jgi:hypothetical protein